MVNVALHQIVCMISLLVLYVMLPLLLAIEVTLLTPPVSGILLLHNENKSTASYTNSDWVTAFCNIYAREGRGDLDN